MLKTIKQEIPITRNRYVQCPECKTRGLKLKKIIRVGRCRACHETYKIIARHVKPGDNGERPMKPQFQAPKTGLPAWQVPSDTSLFGSPGNSFAGRAYGWGQTRNASKDETGSER